MPAPDPKVKKAEPNPHLGIDSPMVIWFTDLESLGLRDVVFPVGGGGTGDAGGGTSGGGSGSPDPSGGGEPPPEPEPTDEYVAVCEEVQHSPKPPVGAVVDGRWIGTLHDRFDPAQAEASAHEHGSAYVALYVRGNFIGPVKPF
jgi:hypothetical protein